VSIIRLSIFLLHAGSRLRNGVPRVPNSLCNIVSQKIEVAKISLICSDETKMLRGADSCMMPEVDEVIECLQAYLVP
jgi:hypothetical protein